MSATAQPLNILSVVPYDLAPEAGGVKVHAEKLNEALRARGHRVTLLGPASLPLLRAHTIRTSGVINIPANGSDNFLGLWVNPWALRRILARTPHDIVHLHEPQMPLLSYWVHWLTPRVPKVATFHAYSEEPGLALARAVSARLVLGGVRQGIAVSQAALGQAQLSYKGPLTIVPNGVDTALFAPSAAAPAMRGEGSDATDGPPRLQLVFVGRLNEPRKGLSVLLDAFAAALRAGMPVELHLVGDGRRAAPLPALPHLHHHQELGPVAFARLLASADALVAPALGQESFGMILIEAMAAGTDVICSDNEGYRAVVEGTDALLVQPGDVQGLMEAMRVLIGLTAQERAARAARFVAFAQRFAWTKLAGDVERIYALALRP